jgi:hypothetical protein
MPERRGQRSRAVGVAIGAALFLVAVSGAGGCGRKRSATETRPVGADPKAAPGSRTAPGAAASAAPPLRRRPAAERVVALGDLHGDLDATLAALRAAGAVDEAGHWRGGRLVVVQTGDQLDRGDQEEALLDALDRLAREAATAGGAVVVLNGNHELMNAAGDFRYVTPAGFDDFGGAAARRAAFAPGGPFAVRLAERSIYAIVGDTLFVHGGVLPAHVDAGLERLDAEARAWLRGERTELPAVLVDPESPIWTRRYALPDGVDCAAAKAVLAGLELRRMVVAHTVQEHGIGAVCDGAVWRIDVGLARHYGGPIEVFELQGDDARVVRGSR